VDEDAFGANDLFRRPRAVQHKPAPIAAGCHGPSGLPRRAIQLDHRTAKSKEGDRNIALGPDQRGGGDVLAAQRPEKAPHCGQIDTGNADVVMARQSGAGCAGTGAEFDPRALRAFQERIPRARRPEFRDEQRAVGRDIAVKHPAPRQCCRKGGIDIIYGQRQMVDPAMSRCGRILVQLDQLIAKAKAMRPPFGLKSENLRQLVRSGGGIANVQPWN